MMTFPIESLDDPRVAAYRNMKDKELARDGRRFVAEGEQVVRRLLASRLKTESVLLSPRKAEKICPLVPEHIPIWIASDAVVEQIIGFEFHSGVMAIGIRPESMPLESIIPQGQDRMTLAILQEITNTENMGSLVRVGASFGVDAMILGEHCCDPFFRQSVRVSMGAVFKLPMISSKNLIRDLKRLREEWGFELAATVLAEDALPLTNAGRGNRLAILFGNEAQGLDAATIGACDRKVTIPMKLGTDSLNVAVAAGVFLYHFTK